MPFNCCTIEQSGKVYVGGHYLTGTPQLKVFFITIILFFSLSTDHIQCQTDQPIDLNDMTFPQFVLFMGRETHTERQDMDLRRIDFGFRIEINHPKCIKTRN